MRTHVMINCKENIFRTVRLRAPGPKRHIFYQLRGRSHSFSEGKEPKPGDKIVYTAGAFDLFRILNSKNIGWERKRRPFYDFAIFCNVVDKS